jgi:hypothetical protein
MMNVSRRLGMAAWVAATVLSVMVSTAAVESVRAQVTERPAVVSLATLRQATSTTSTAPSSPAQAQPARPPSTTTSTTVVETTTTTRASVEATPATTVETTAPPATSPPATAPPREESEPVTETRTFRGGSVTISFDGDSIQLLEATTDEGFELSVEQQQAQRIVVRFVADGRSSGLVAQVTREGLQIRVFD